MNNPVNTTNPIIGAGVALMLLSYLTGLAAQTSTLTNASAPEKTVAQAKTPPPAPGYQNPAQVLAAIALKQIKLITPPTNLPPGVVELKDIEYGKAGERSLQLDLYLPEKRTKPVPGLIFIHGGAWSGGNRGMYKYYTIRYAQRGYVAATISYRLSGQAPFPAAVEDAKCAVRWLRANAAKYQVNPNLIGVIGGSAGGHSALMVGYSSDVPQLEGAGGHHKVSSRVQAVVDIYGVYDMTTLMARQARPVIKFLDNKTYDEAPDLYLRASPKHYLTKDDPPTLILHGTIDDVVPIAQSDLLAARLKELGVPFLYDRLEGWPHVMDLAESVNERCQFFMNEFFAQHLPLPK